MLVMLVVTGDLSLLINPKFRILIIFSIVILLILGMVQCWNLKEKELHTVGFWGYFLTLMPIVIYICFPPKALDASMINKKGVSLIQSSQVNNRQPTSSQRQKNEEIPYKNILEKMKKETFIQFDENNYADYLSVLEIYPNELKGKRIRIKGFVFRDDPQLQKDEFVLSRFTVSCCAADATVVGIITKTPKAPTFKEDQWMEVEGTLSTIRVYGFDQPLILLESSREVSRPKDPYIYFDTD